RQPVIMIRDRSDEVHVLLNRCAHKGAKLLSAPTGNLKSALRCPYHGWSYRYDGSVHAIPMAKGYENTGLKQAPANEGLTRIRNVVNYRGFVFARLSDEGMSFEDYFGESVTSIDNMVDRSPEGRLEIAGGILRYMHDCNWKMFIENLNDTMHPMVAHQSSAGTATKVWYAAHEKDEPRPMVVEQFEPFVGDYDFFDKMGVKIYNNGHSYSGVHFSIHSAYSAIPGYFDALVEAYGEDKAKETLSINRHNTVYYPTLTIKGAIQAIRIARPIAANKTLIESWTFRLAGAPEDLLKRTLMYSRLINAPTSVVGHDDLHCYSAIQQGLVSGGNEWISLHRDHDANAEADIDGTYNGTSEISMRGQFRAWRDQMVAAVNEAND
ncbi:MAG: aromatic ring-hydroxylating dioxygenase subunit alpha, partial [Pseudomonadota bacterium]